ncbi:MAG: hypothetical protein ABFR90_00860 [Planctomycetota bacterium]
MSKGRLIKAELYSRPNVDKYRVTRLGLDDLSKIKDSNTFLLETLQMEANLADKMIAEAESEGKDTTDPNVMKELGEEINAVSMPIHRSESVMTAIFISLQLLICYGIAIGIWGLVFKKSFLEFGFYGVVVGLLISLLFVSPVIAFQRTKSRIRDVVFGVHVTFGGLGFIIALVGLIALVIRLIFF